jgi:phosphoenolpyruvate carboxylase
MISASAFGFTAPDWGATFNERRWNEEMVENANFFSAQQAATAHQREVADLKAAGLNPMLTMHHQGAPAPQGQLAHAAPMQRMGIPGPSNAAQIENIEAATDKTRAEAAEIRERTPTHGVERELTAHKSAEIRQSIAESAMRIEKIIAQTGEATSSAAHLDQQVQNLRAVLPQIRQTVDLLAAQTGETANRFKANLPGIQRSLAELERIYKEMEMPGRQTDEAYAASKSGAVLRSIGNALRSLNPLLPSTSSSSSSSIQERR